MMNGAGLDFGEQWELQLQWWHLYVVMGAAYVVWLCWRYRLREERRAAWVLVRDATKPENFVTLYALLCAALVAVAVMFTLLPAYGVTRWPTSAELQRCEPWPKDAKLRAWCTYWSKRLP